MFGAKKAADTSVAVPILCKFWFEDGVWNGVAADLAVAAFGSSFEEAMANLRTAIGSHLESVIEAGNVTALITHLQERAREYGFLSLDEISPSSPLVKMLVAMKNQELVAVT
ncbi:MAG: type II toxin-antitoxin system HicB family antitoxin [Terriglobia bacterium]